MLLCLRHSTHRCNVSRCHSHWLLLLQASRTGSDLWLAWAAAHPARPSDQNGSAAVSTAQFLQGLMGFAAASVVCALVGHLHVAVLVPHDATHPAVIASGLAWLHNMSTAQVRAFSFAYAGLVAAKHLHAALLAAVLGSPCTFFEQTSTGWRAVRPVAHKCLHCLDVPTYERYTHARGPVRLQDELSTAFLQTKQHRMTLFLSFWCACSLFPLMLACSRYAGSDRACM